MHLRAGHLPWEAPWYLSQGLYFGAEGILEWPIWPGEEVASYSPKWSVRYSRAHPAPHVYKAPRSNLGPNKSKQNLPDQLVPSEQSPRLQAQGQAWPAPSHKAPTLHLYPLLSELPGSSAQPTLPRISPETLLQGTSYRHHGWALEASTK